MPDIPQIIDSDINDGEAYLFLRTLDTEEEHPIGYQLFTQPVSGDGNFTNLLTPTQGRIYPRSKTWKESS